MVQIDKKALKVIVGCSVLVLLVVIFNNCSGGFRSVRQAVLNSSQPVPTPAPVTLIPTATAVASPSAMLPQIDCSLPNVPNADTVWNTWRRTQNLVNWPDVIPTNTSTIPKINISSDGRLMLFHNSNYIALFRSPLSPNSPYAGLMGLADRRYGEDFIRPGQNATGAPWALCLGTPTTNPVNCDFGPNSSGYLSGHPYKPTQCLISNSTSPLVPAQPCSNGISGDTLVLVWTGVEGGVNIQQTWRLTPNSGLLHRISVSGLATTGNFIGARPISIRAPTITSLGRDVYNAVKTTQMIAPMYNNGYLHDADMNNSVFTNGRRGIYPDAYHLQFFGYLDRNYGFYFGAEDPNFSPKEFNAIRPNSLSLPGAGLNHASYHTYFARDPGTSIATINPNWDVRLKPVCADHGWIQVAQEYRSWALSPSVPRPLVPLKNRTDLPQDVRDGLLWYLSTPTLLNADVQRAETITPGQKIGFHFYLWYENLFDQGNGGVEGGFKLKDPNYITYVANARTRGHHVVPYINPNFSDSSDINDNRQTAVQNECTSRLSVSGDPTKQFNGCGSTFGNFSTNSSFLKLNASGSDTQYPFKLYPFFARAGGAPNGGSFLTAVCPAPAGWKSKVQEMWTSVLQLNPNGVYLDTYGKDGAACWNSNHGHTLGYGNHMIQHHKDEINQLSPTKSARGIYVSSEFISEPYLDMVDFTFNYQERTPYTIPLFQSIYHEFHTLVGPRSSAYDSDQAFAFKTGMSLVAGDQLGLNTMSWINSPAKENVLRVLSLARTRLKSYLSFGQYIAPLVQIGTPAKTTVNNWCLEANTCSSQVTATVDSIHGSFWRSGVGAGLDALILVNLNQSIAQSVMIKIPFFLQGKRAYNCALDGSNCVNLDVVSRITLAPLEVKLIQFWLVSPSLVPSAQAACMMAGGGLGSQTVVTTGNVSCSVACAQLECGTQSASCLGGWTVFNQTQYQYGNECLVNDSSQGQGHTGKLCCCSSATCAKSISY